MKKILIIAFILFSIQMFAQTNEGTVYFTRTTYWTKMNNQLSYLSKQEKEKMTYMFAGKDDWKEYMLLHYNDNESKYVASEERSEESEGYAWRKEEFSVARNFSKNTMLDVFEILGKTYIIEDSLQTPNWKILNDIKEVAGHICMKAMIEDTLKKQKIIAWFAQDIPSNAGPERLWGLPGLILELDINDGTVLIQASKIESKKLTQELAPPKKLKGKKMNESAYQEMLKKIIQEKIKEERNPFWFIRY
ncbi:GLPGLI family protein [Arcicella lustrica]|uniref:GLPGLI family protein n=1 Tax=Arcicella lustrica TaxID=2984196 RepID=A0ABU5SEJ0_9BACT|nr:GLPGLI family protein [Arcicella sp. DC25W]MEA5425705.1 GLPGLI family protein [Arcicella sp. DC25W]